MIKSQPHNDERRAELLAQLRHMEVEIARIRASLAESAAAGSAELPDSFAMLVFDAGGGRFGIRTEQVREVIRLVRLEPISDAPAAVLGAMNFRGTRVAVVDMCQRLTGRRATYGLDTPIIVAQRSVGLIGLLVDSVATVEPTDASEIEPPSNDLPQHAALLGSVERDGRFVHLLDAALLLAGDEGRALAEAVRASSTLRQRDVGKLSAELAAPPSDAESDDEVEETRGDVEDTP